MKMALNGTVCENLDAFLLVSGCQRFKENCLP
jgi:hypothetical protein